jgi:CheY-like chemotaxis protein
MIVSSTSLNILVVDDDHGHCELVTRNLRRAGVSNPIEVVHSGAEALNFLFRREQYVNRPPCEELLVLLDINMPGRFSGFDVLREVKACPETKLIPVVMLTTTDNPKEINLCYDLGCSVYITKPVDPGKFIEAVTNLGLLISVVRLPNTAMGI